MSPRKNTTVEPPMIPADALQTRAADRFHSALERYRQAVAAAANADGNLPEDVADDVLEHCRTCGIPVEQFPDDVAAWREFETQRRHLSAMEMDAPNQSALARQAVADIERLEGEIFEARRRHQLHGDYWQRRFASVHRSHAELIDRFPHLLAETASVTPQTVQRTLTTRAFFVRD
jgi:hypothetical protein